MNRLVALLLLALFPLMGVASLLPGRYGIWLVLGYLVMSATVALVTSAKRIVRSYWHSVAVALFFAYVLTGYFTASHSIPDVVTASAPVILACLYSLVFAYAMVLAITQPSGRAVLTMIFASLVALHLLNIAAWLANVQNAKVIDLYLRPLEPMFQSLGPRQILPLSGGLASSAMVSALGGLSALALLKWPLTRINYAVRLILLIAYASGLFGIVIVGNRMIAIVFVVVSAVTILADGFFRRRGVVLAVAGLYLFPLAYLAIFPILEDSQQTAWMSVVSRSGNAWDVLTLSNRVFIWREIVSAYSQADSAWWLGYGAYGQVISGISERYSQFFEGTWSRPEIASAHSAALQLMMDRGVVGVAGFLAIMILAVRRVKTLGKSEFVGPATMLLMVFAAFAAIESEVVVDGLVANIFLFSLAYLTATGAQPRSQSAAKTITIRPRTISHRLAPPRTLADPTGCIESETITNDLGRDRHSPVRHPLEEGSTVAPIAAVRSQVTAIPRNDPRQH